MNEWREVRLGGLVDLFDYKRVPLSSQQRSTRPGPFPYYGAQGVIDYIDDFIFEGKFILIPEDGENLRSRKLPIAYFADGQFWVNNHAHIARARPGLAVDRFLQSAIEATDIGPFVTGAAQPKLSQANLRQIPVRIPPLVEQCAIAEVLDALDDSIENNRRRAEVLEEMTRAIYREWFVRFRYPGNENVPLVDSPFGPIPDGWEALTLGDVLVLRYGKALTKDDRRGGPVAVVSSAGVVGWHDEALVSGPTIVVGRKGTVGSVTWVDGDAWPIDTAYWVESALPLRYVVERLRGTAFLNSRCGARLGSRPGIQPTFPATNDESDEGV